MADTSLTTNDALQPGNSPRKTGLKLVLPPLSVVQARKKLKGQAWRDVVPSPVQREKEREREKVARPVKLKPLKAVLAKLIAQIKKKDDYAFFLAPVDASQVPGYADVIKQPMDFGTITRKVERGRYRALEEFANDIRLVTTNAKTFNPLGTIYHSEADRIEAFAIDHINKAAATVIEYEGDWSIDVANDGRDTPSSPDEDEKSTRTQTQTQDGGTPMDVDGSTTRGRSPSVASTLQTPLLGMNGHAPRKGKGRKQQPGMSEALEPDGHLPGCKDGIGVFPPGSDWAEVMVSLKLKGKRYRTKKERLRMEKGGPPYHADGSLDYPEMEDPFSVLSVLVPDALSKPQLTPLFPTTDSSFPAPINLHSTRPLPAPPALLSLPRTAATATSRRRRHWTITRTAPPRRARDTHHPPSADTNTETTAPPAPRLPHPTDFGAFAHLPGHLAHEHRLSSPSSITADLGTEAQVTSAIKRVVDHAIAWRHPGYGDDEMDLREGGYWVRRGRQAEDWLRDVVYGGVEGLGYVRSLAEFVMPGVGEEEEEEEEEEGWSDMEVDEYDEDETPRVEDTSLGGASLAQYVEQTVVDPLTGSRHALLRDTARRLCSLPPLPSSSFSSATHTATDAHLQHSLHTLPNAARSLVELRKIAAQPLDMAALLRAPEELFVADGVWAGRAYVEGGRERVDARVAGEVEVAGEAEGEGEGEGEGEEERNALRYLELAVRTHERAQARAGAGAGVETREMLEHALRYSADLIVELAKRSSGGGEGRGGGSGGSTGGKIEEEDAAMRELRMNLLALAKRAPLDKIARLPAELVPEPIRHIVPTVRASQAQSA